MIAGFIIGTFIGGAFGIGLMCLLNAGKDDEE